MVDHTTTEVYKYFLSLERYALGDLLLFHKLSVEAENNEIDSGAENPPTTTMYPFGFEFVIGKPVFCRATIPFTLLIFSCMDILGYLIKGKKHTDTQGNIKTFYTYVSMKPPENEIDCLIKIYRHGLVHNYFPKLGRAISYHSKNPNKLFFKDSNVICLNVNILEQHLNEGFQKIKEDESLYEEMEKNFSLLTKLYRENEKCNLLQ